MTPLQFAMKSGHNDLVDQFEDQDYLNKDVCLYHKTLLFSLMKMFAFAHAL